MLTMYDLVGANNNGFSPYCWRTRMALAHKQLDYNCRATRFTEIAAIGDGNFKTLPVIEDEGHLLGDSWAIASHLERKYADRPSLFGGGTGQTLTLFIQEWTNNTVIRGLFDLVVWDIFQQLAKEDKPYFRESRERALGCTLEEAQSGREQRVQNFRKSLLPLRKFVLAQHWLGGLQPMYADYIVFAAFQWARVVSPFSLLEPDDPIAIWFERCLDLFDGLGRNAVLSNR